MKFNLGLYHERGRQSPWGLSPNNFNTSNAIGYGVYTLGSSNHYVSYSTGVRPAVSLRTGIEYMSGDGSSDIPYVIDMDS